MSNNTIMSDRYPDILVQAWNGFSLIWKNLVVALEDTGTTSRKFYDAFRVNPGTGTGDLRAR